MQLMEFFQKLKQHCRQVDHTCIGCCFRDFCYCVPKDYTEEFINKIIDHLSK